MENQNKLLIVFFVLTILTGNYVYGQTISPRLFGENAWMPDTIGTVYLKDGALHNQWPKIKNSSARTIRFGGILPDTDKPTEYQYLKMVDSIRANGMEPVIQVPFYMYRYSNSEAANIVRFLNITKARNVKYWSIGNEPNLKYGYTTSAQISAYIKSFSSAMKQVDPSIKIFGPEVAWYDNNIMNGLLNPGGPDDITGKDASGNFYVDYITFHEYSFNGSQTRSDVISILTSSGRFQDDLESLNSAIISCNNYHQRTGDKGLKTALTEGNISTKNGNDGLSGVGTSSFLAGQFWAEMIGISMKKNVEMINFWSVIEGSELGYLSQDAAIPKSTYYHFQLLANNFRGSFCNGTDNLTNVKSFGSKDSHQVAVIILNQEQTTNYKYTVRLNNGIISGNNPLKINIDANLDKEFQDTIKNQSTVLLIFDGKGKIKKRFEYSLAENASQNLAPSLRYIIPKYRNFAVIGDYGVNNSNELAVSNLVKSWDPDFIITTGDNNYQLGDSTTIDSNIGKYYHDYISPYKGTYGAGADSNIFFPSLGNHDLMTNNGSPYLKYFTLPGNERYYDFVNGPVHFFVINSDSSEADGTDTTSIQALWLKNKLGTSNSPWNVVYFHHPPFSSDNDRGSNYYMRWPYSHWGANTIISGHAHLYERLEVNGTPYFINGAGGQTRDGFISSPLPESRFRYNQNFGAMKVYASPDTMIFKFFNINGTLIDSYILKKIYQFYQISISSPTNNSVFQINSDINISAVVQGNSFPIQKVEFFNGNSKLGEDLSAPFLFSWKGAQPGNYSLTAVSTDSLGNIRTSSPISVSVVSSSKIDLVSSGGSWKYLDNGTNQGTAWRSTSFNDATWKTGTAELGYGDGGEVTIVKYGSNSSSKYVTTYFRKTINVANPSSVTSLDLSILRDDGAVVYINGSEVFRTNMKSGSISYTTLASSNVEGSAESTYYSKSISPSFLISGNNTIAVEVHQVSKSSSDLSFNLKLVATIGNSTVCNVPDQLDTASVKSNSAVLKWSAVPGATGYYVQYRKTGTTTWTTQLVSTNSLSVSGLSTSTNYEFHVCTACSSIYSNYSYSFFFTTSSESFLVSAGSSWKYLDNGSNMGTTWKNQGFNDSGWKTGNAELGYGDGGEATVVSYGTSSTNKYITTYFRKTFNIQDKSAISGLELSLIRDDGAVVYINGVEVFRSNLPSGQIYYNTLAPAYIDGTNESTYQVATIGASSLVNGTNVIAVEIHQNSVSSSDISFNLKLKALSGGALVASVSEITLTGYQEQFPLCDMIAYPNPETETYTMEFSAKESDFGSVKIEILDPFGRLVYQKTHQRAKSIIEGTIELNGTLPSGVYRMNISSGSKKESTRLFLSK